MTKKGYKQILLTEEVYEEVKKRKGKQSFSAFIKELLQTPTIDDSKGEARAVSIQNEAEKEGRTEEKAGVTIPTEDEQY